MRNTAASIDGWGCGWAGRRMLRVHRIPIPGGPKIPLKTSKNKKIGHNPTKFCRPDTVHLMLHVAPAHGGGCAWGGRHVLRIIRVPIPTILGDMITARIKVDG